MKPLPRALTICGMPWRVRRKKMPTMYGLCDPDKMTIWIDSGSPLEFQWAFLIGHEVFHAIEYATEGDRTLLEKAAKRCGTKRRDCAAIDPIHHSFIHQVDEPYFVFLRDNFGVGL